MYETEASCGSEFCPVGRSLEPVQVLSEEDVAGGAKVHQAVTQDSGVVSDGVPT